MPGGGWFCSVRTGSQAQPGHLRGASALCMRGVPKMTFAAGGSWWEFQSINLGGKESHLKCFLKISLIPTLSLSSPPRSLRMVCPCPAGPAQCLARRGSEAGAPAFLGAQVAFEVLPPPWRSLRALGHSWCPRATHLCLLIPLVNLLHPRLVWPKVDSSLLSPLGHTQLPLTSNSGFTKGRENWDS